MDTKTPIISLREVNLQRQHRTILKDVNLDIFPGDFITITGPNGGGKTTLLRIILRLLKPSTGSVHYFEDNQEVRRLHIGYLPQKNMIDGSFPITVKQVIASGLINIKNLQPEQIDKRIDHILDLLGLKHRAEFTLDRLSGGQLQRTLFGRALISNPQILILDEPLSYLDKEYERRVCEIIADIASHTTIVLVSHELSRIAAMANRHIIVDGTLHHCHSAHHAYMPDCE